MRAPLLYGILPSVLAAAVFLACALRFLPRLLPHVPRVLLGGLGALGALALTLVGGQRLASGVTQATWCCDVCGRNEARVGVFGLVVERTTLAPEAGPCWRTERYARWLESQGAPAHAHAFVPVSDGARVGFGTVFACYGFPRTFHEALPRLPDPDVARSLVARLARAGADERAELLDDFERRRDDAGSSGLMRALAAGSAVSAEDFAAAYPVWLAEHPRWNAP